MKRNKRLKKVIMGGIGFAMAVIVFFVGSMRSMQDVSADIRVFDKITEKYPYEANKAFKLNVLEIVPGDPATSKEIGYFLTNQEDHISPTRVTHGTVHAAPFDSRLNPGYGDALYNFRMYGLIRPSGTDTNGSYPIYATNNNAAVAVFSNYQTTMCANSYPINYVKGVYELGQGDYLLHENYTIGEDGRIYEIVKVPIVSDNSVSDNSTLSENNATYDPETNTITELVPVTDIDMSALSLPKSKSGLEYIKWVGDGKGNLTFKRSETATDKVEYYGYSEQVLYYAAGNHDNDGFKFHSSSFFKEFVLGSKKNYASKNITYTTVKASEVTTNQIADADLIYISGKSADFALANGDISQEILLELYNQEVNNHKAIMMDYACYNKEATTNVSKLAMLLWRESQNEIRTTYASAFADKKQPNVMTNLDFLTNAVMRDLKDSMMSGANGSFVTGNVYVYNHHKEDFENPRSLVDAGDNFANGDFNSSYTASAMQAGFTHVLSYITTTNKNSTTGMMLPSVTPAVAIQYILISDGNPLTIVKSSLNVLEIQPVMSFLYNDGRGSEEYGYLEDGSTVKNNRDMFVKTYLGDYYDDKAEYVQFTSMTIDEFNGRNDDLIENYDIIYIGSEMGELYFLEDMETIALKETTDSSGNKTLMYDSALTPQTKKLPSYIDTAMNGNVYYNIGDTLNIWYSRLGKYFENDISYSRYAGRDLTKDKLAKLKAYLEGEHLILVAGDLMSQTASGVTKINPTAITTSETKNKHEEDHGRVDNSSNLYELLQFAQGYRFNYSEGKYENASTAGAYDYYENLISVADITNNVVSTATVDRYVATEKLAINLIEKPREYSYMTQTGSKVIDEKTIQYLEENANGTRELKYEFIISSNIDNSFESISYTPSLYIDVNNDGKYSTIAENVRDITIVNKVSGAEADKNEEGIYVLYKDVHYVLTRGIDDSYQGYLKWKLNIQSNTYENTHASEQGSTVVKHKGEKQLIKVLQITKGKKSTNQNGVVTYSKEGTTLDIEAQLNNRTSLFYKYLSNVPGYEVQVNTITMDEFEDLFMAEWQKNLDSSNSLSIQEFALKYFNNVTIKEPTTVDGKDGLYGADMLVLGFADCFPSLKNKEAVTALQTYMENEKPVLLTHDFILFWAQGVGNNADNPNDPGYHAPYLRQNVGMDKYGMTQNIKVEKDKEGNITDVKLVNAQLYPNEAGYLHTGLAYTRNKDEGSTDKDKFAAIEATGKAVAYQPGSGRGTIVETLHGVSNYALQWFTGENEKTDGQDNLTERSWLNSLAARTTYFGAAEYDINKINDGQITSYPYQLPDKMSVARSHGQYYQLDLDADTDEDGESDVVVWYTLGHAYSNTFEHTDTYNVNFDPWNDEVGGPVPSDGYYIYNKGNVTYTGAGHSSIASTSDYEVQLFVNTLFAAYNAGKTSPSVSFFETAPDATSAPITSIAIPYDENVSKESSVLKDTDGEYKYQFVNPNPNPDTHQQKEVATPVFFRLEDSNFVRGNKYMQIEYYLKADGKAKDAEFNLAKEFGLNDTDTRCKKKVEMIKYKNATIPVVNITNLISTYRVSNKALGTKLGESDLDFLESGMAYGFYLPLTYLKENSQVTIYIKAKTKIYTVSSQTNQATIEYVPGEGVSELTVTKAELLELD